MWGCLQVMTSGQRVPFEFYGTNYIFTVNQALQEGQESSTPLDRGFLSSDTYIIFEAAPNSGIKVPLNNFYFVISSSTNSLYDKSILYGL